ncbi:hypothetical protein NVP1100O_03 [Vibrio phage 1.100.O._10N.261.45.C3]|nr:hypothetical protein NVP1100O_03 [Vibrio phage 1.100.O._10N.261.45.C3]
MKKRNIKTPKDMVRGHIHATENSGDLKIINHTNSKNVLIEFINTGKQRITNSSSIRGGMVKDFYAPLVYGVGFMAEGDFTSRLNGKVSPAYKAWTHMLERCYDHKLHIKHPTYKDCTVDPTWHNFQNFAKWYFDNYPTDGEKYELDKDILVDGNKTYGPDFCIFASRKSNVTKAHAKSYSFTNPLGIKIDVYNLSELCRNEDLNHGNMVQVSKGKMQSHKGWTKA